MKINKYKEFLENYSGNTKIKLPNDIIEISDAYIKAGKDIFLVGGAVRDSIKGIEPKDYDLVTNALPEESKIILKNFNVSDEQGKNFGVIRVYTKDEPEGYEIASYRRDISGGRDTKGDDQKVEMGPNVTIEDDCSRRDISMNALFYDIKNKKIVDLVGGIDDIKNGVIRAVGDANQRFIEDRLRIMRIFRFSARMVAKIDQTTADAIRNDRRLKGIGPKDDVSQERIWEEMCKAFKQSKDYNHYLSLLTEFDMWGQVFPGVKINTNFTDSQNFVVIITNLLLGNDTEKLETKLIQEFKIDGDLAKKIVFLLDLNNMTADDVFDTYKKKLSSGISNQTIIEWLRVTNNTTPILTRFLDYKPTVSATELMGLGFKGPELGLEIKRREIEIFKK